MDALPTGVPLKKKVQEHHKIRDWEFEAVAFYVSRVPPLPA